MKVHARKILGRGLLAVCLSLSFVAVQAGTLIGSSSRGDDPASIYSIDTDTGVATLIGPIGLIEPIAGANKVSAIALDPITGTYYAIWGSACFGAKLITVDLDTGAGTLIGTLIGAGFNASGQTFCDGGADALEFSADGRLYSEGFNAGFVGGNLLEIDKSDGTVLSVTATTGNQGVTGMARAPDGTMWVSEGALDPGIMHTIDLVTGQFLSTLVLSDTSIVISDIAFGVGGILYGSAPRTTGKLVTINTVTGAVANVGPFGGGARIAGLASVGVVPVATCTVTLGGCNPTQNLNIEIPDDIPLPPGIVLTQTVASRHDPRPDAGTCGTDELIVFGDDPEISDLVIPPGICGDPFIVVSTDTDLEVLRDTIIMTNEPDAFFGGDAKECQPSIPVGEDPQNEDEVVWMGTDGAFQDDGFANTTTFECGSSRGRSRGFSHNVIGMSINFSLNWGTDTERDAVRQAFIDVGHLKHARLIRAVTLSKNALPRREWKELHKIALFANFAYNRRSYAMAITKLTLLLSKVQSLELAPPPTFDISGGYNHAGNITTRADNLRYFIDKYVIGLEVVP